MHMKSVIGESSSTKATAQIWRLLSPAEEVSHCIIFFHQGHSADLAATISCIRSYSLEYILPTKQLPSIGGYYPLHMKSVIAIYSSTKATAQIWRLLTRLHTKLVIAVYTSTKVAAQIWRLLSHAYEIRNCRILFHQSNRADLAATIPCI